MFGRAVFAAGFVVVVLFIPAPLKVWSAVLLAVGAGVLLGTAASHGASHCGEFFGTAAAFLVLGAGCAVVSPSGRDAGVATRSTAPEARGTRLLWNNAVPMAIVLFGGAAGCLVGAAFYRPHGAGTLAVPVPWAPQRHPDAPGPGGHCMTCGTTLATDAYRCTNCLAGGQERRV